MARKVPKDDLPHLLTWLEQYLPDSYVIHGELTSHLRGQFTDVDFFVDTWPLPQAAVAILNPAADQLPSNQDRKMTIVECMHFLNLRALRSLLWDCSLVDWNHCVSLGGVPGSVVPEILEAARESGKSVSFYLYHLMKATPNDLKAIPIPEGLKLQPISTAEIHTMYTTWKLAYEKTETYVREIAERFPSIYLVTDNGQHVGHMVGTVDGTMEMLHVSPQFRRKGHAKVIVSQLAQKYFDQGEDAFVYIEEDNAPSLSLHKSLGFKMVGDGLTFSWMMCD